MDLRALAELRVLEDVFQTIQGMNLWKTAALVGPSHNRLPSFA